MKKLSIGTHVSIVSVAVLCIIMFLFNYSTHENANDEQYNKYVSENYRVFSLSTPEHLDFAGEDVPLFLTDIKERFDRELLVNTYWQSQTLLFHKRANRWFPLIEQILSEEGIPNDFKFLCLAESGLQNVVSQKGATGFWQFMETSGEQYNLEINNEVDERYNVEKSTRAAAAYLKESKEKYGSWSMAAASYNMGNAALDKQINRQGEDNYFNLLLSEETQRYLFRILALKEVINNATKYGFHFRPKDLYPPFQTKTVVINGPVEDFAQFAKDHEINYKILKLLNPWLRDNKLSNPNGKEYEIQLPVEGEANLMRYEP